MKDFGAPRRTIAAAAIVLAVGLLTTGCAESFPAGNAPPETRPEAVPVDSGPPLPMPSTPVSTRPSTQGSGAPLQVITIPLGKQSGVEARLPINGYSGPPGAEITYDASGSIGVVIRYEWDLNGDGSYDRTTTDPVLKHFYKVEFEGVMILRVTGIAGGTDTLETPVRISNTPTHQYLAAPLNVQAEVLSTVDGISIVKVSWESDDPAADSWGVAVNGFPAGRVEKSARSVEVRDVRRDEDVLLEIIGMTAAGALGERAGTVLPAGR